MAIPLIGAAARVLASGGGRAVAGQAIGQAAGVAAGGMLSQLEALANPLTAVTVSFGMLTRVMQQAEAPFKAAENFFAHIGSYVAKFSPVRMEFFQRAVADFEAAIGRTLIPVLEAGTRVFRKFGDAIVQNSPKLEAISKMVANFVEKLGDLFIKLIKDLSEMPGLLTIIDASLQTFLATMKVGAAGIKASLSNPTSGIGLAAFIARQFGGETPQNNGSARNLAFQQTATESVTGMIGRLQQQAFGQSNDPAVQTADNTGKLLSYFTDGVFAADVANALRDALQGAAAQGATGLASRGIGAMYGAPAREAFDQGVNSFNSDPLNFLRGALVSNIGLVL